MRIFLAAIVALATVAEAVAQASPPPVYPLPPPEPSVITAPDGRDVPSRLPSDRSTRCLQYAASIAVPANQLEDYLKRCAVQ